MECGECVWSVCGVCGVCVKCVKCVSNCAMRMRLRVFSQLFVLMRAVFAQVIETGLPASDVKESLHKLQVRSNLAPPRPS